MTKPTIVVSIDGTPVEPTKPDAGEKRESTESRWVAASAEVRSTAKWVIATAGSVGAAVFAGGPFLSKGEISGDHLAGRVGLVLLSTAVGAFGIIYLIGKTAQVLMPYKVTLVNLPASLRQKIAADPDAYLPDHLTDIQVFRQRLAMFDLLSRSLPDQAADRKQRATQEADQNVKRQLEREAHQFETSAAIASRNSTIYKEVRTDLLDQAEYDEVNSRFVFGGKSMAAAGIAAMLAAVTYLMLWNVPSDDDAAADSAPRLGLLVKDSTPSNLVLWEQTRIAGCETTHTSSDGSETEAQTVVPVVVKAGTGSPDDPYNVQTIGSVSPQAATACPIVSFTVINEVALIKFPADTVRIEYVESTTASAAAAHETTTMPSSTTVPRQ